MKAAFLLLAIAGWSAFGYQRYEQHRRISDVELWAGSAYDQGAFDASYKPSVRAYNRAFVVRSIVAAHNGAWD